MTDNSSIDSIDTTGKEIEEYKRRNRKVRRGGKRIKNKLKNFKILYSNLRGFKSKTESIKNIIEEEKPTMIALAETLIEDDE